MKKIPVWKNILLIFALIASIIIATLAWFFKDPHGMLDGMVLDVGEASFIQVSADNGNHWSEDLEVNFGINKDFEEISGNGTNFFEPVYDVVETADGALEPTIVGFESVSDTDCYYEQIFTFRSDGDQDVYLSPESFVTAVSEDAPAYIDGAIRVAFFELDEQDRETLKYIWVPNSKTEFSNTTNAFTKDGKIESYYHYQKTTTPVDVSILGTGASNPNIASIPTHGNGTCPGCGYHASSKFLWSCGEHMPENAPSLINIRADQADGMGYNRVKIKVWLEGYDRECVSLVRGQKFTMKFQFSSERGE